MPTKESIKYFETREAWREWLETNFETATEVWFVHPKKLLTEKPFLIMMLWKKLFVSVGLTAR